MNKIGRPRKPETMENLNLSSFKEDIQLFRNSLVDYIDEEDTDQQNIPCIKKFLKLEKWRQNLFIVYLIYKDKKKTLSDMATMLNVERNDIIDEIKQIKKDLKQDDSNNS